MRCSAWVPFLLALAGRAHAEPSQPFQTLDRLGEDSAVGLSLSTLGYPDAHPLDSSWRVDFYGRGSVGPVTFYGLVSWSHAVWRNHQYSSNLHLRNWDAASNLELGASYVLRPRNHAVYLRAGLLLPTADGNYDYANVGTTAARITDTAATTHGAVWLRPGVTVRGALPSRAVFYQLDGSLCVPIRTADDPRYYSFTVRVDPYQEYPVFVIPTDDVEPNQLVAVVNAGLGAALGPAQATIESANTFEKGRHMHTLAATLAARTERVVPYVGVVVPVAMGDLEASYTVSVGVHARP